MCSLENLSSKRCQPCEGVTKPLTHDQAMKYFNEIREWQISDDGKIIFRNFVMKNFSAAIGLIKNIATVAESENHHPDIHLTGYRKLRIELTTHAIDGLSENDFIVASKINALPMELKK